MPSPVEHLIHILRLLSVQCVNYVCGAPQHLDEVAARWASYPPAYNVLQRRQSVGDGLVFEVFYILSRIKQQVAVCKPSCESWQRPGRTAPPHGRVARCLALLPRRTLAATTLPLSRSTSSCRLHVPPLPRRPPPPGRRNHRHSQ